MNGGHSLGKVKFREQIAAWSAPSDWEVGYICPWVILTRGDRYSPNHLQSNRLVIPRRTEDVEFCFAWLHQEIPKIPVSDVCRDPGGSVNVVSTKPVSCDSNPALGCDKHSVSSLQLIYPNPQPSSLFLMVDTGTG